jgi:hypothetical protein
MADEDLDAWRTHDREQARAWRATSYTERLRWLEDAKRLAQKALSAAAERRAATHVDQAQADPRSGAERVEALSSTRDRRR